MSLASATSLTTGFAGIAGGVVGGVLGLALLALVTVWFLRRRHARHLDEYPLAEHEKQYSDAFGPNGDLTSAQMVAMGYQGQPMPSPGGVVPYQPATPSMLAEPVSCSVLDLGKKVDESTFADVFEYPSASFGRRLWLSALASSDARYGRSRRPRYFPREEYEGKVKRVFRRLVLLSRSLFLYRVQKQWTCVIPDVLLCLPDVLEVR